MAGVTPGRLLAAALLCAACAPFAELAPGGGAASIGTTSRGLLLGAAKLPCDGAAYRCYRRPGMRFGAPELVGMVERAAARVAAEADGSVLYVGELSAEHGGAAAGHRSHRSGRDVDLAFFAADPAGRALAGFPVTRFDRFGVGVAAGEGRPRALRFDAGRNWLLVEALLADPEADVQWIFASDGVKALLLRWAIDHDRDPELAERATTVVHQPSDSAPHDDHFHVRIYCPRSAGPECEDVGPVWPWVEGRAAPPAESEDADLAALALEGL